MSLRKLFRMSVFRAATMLTLAPMALHADCLPSVPNGWSVHFTMSSHGINHVVSYTTGTLTGSFFFGTAYFDEHQQPAIWTMPPHFTGVLMSNVVHATRLRTAIGV